MLDVSIIIVSWNTKKLLSECLDSISAYSDGYSIETMVVDNHSTDGTLDLLRVQYPQVRVVVNDDNIGFARANNQGVGLTAGEYVLLLNSDAMLTPGALRSLMELAQSHPKAGMVGARLAYPNDRFQASHSPIPTLRQEFLILSGLGRVFYGSSYPSAGPEEEKGPQKVGYVEGACMLAARKAYLDVCGLDEGYFMYAEDVDICFAMQKKGWEVWYQPVAKIIHVGSASSKDRKPQREADLYRSRVRFFRKYYGSRQAAMLKGFIYFFSILKFFAHTLMRLISRGQWGRPVVSLNLLFSTLKEA
jgi:GT2 family glycosyltransferase